MSSDKSSSFLSDFGINSAIILSKAIQAVSEAKWKHHHSAPESLISNSIILAGSLLGAVFICSTSLIGLNKKWIKEKKNELTVFEILNGSIMIITGGVIVFTSIKALKFLNQLK